MLIYRFFIRLARSKGTALARALGCGACAEGCGVQGFGFGFRVELGFRVSYTSNIYQSCSPRNGHTNRGQQSCFPGASHRFTLNELSLGSYSQSDDKPIRIFETTNTFKALRSKQSPRYKSFRYGFITVS